MAIFYVHFFGVLTNSLWSLYLLLDEITEYKRRLRNMKLSANDIVLKVLGLLLLTAAGLKGHELLTEPVANADIWSNRYFLIFTVELEIALGIWLLSGVFRRIAWIAATICFSLFCCVTLYKALAGFGSCGCFGKVHVNPWVTLFAIDVPAVIALLFVKPKNICNVIANEVSIIYRILADKDVFTAFKKLARPRLAFVSSLTILLILTSSIVLAVNEPATVTTSYEVLDTKTWVGKELPILEHIDIADKIKTGNWLLLFYHHHRLSQLRLFQRHLQQPPTQPLYHCWFLLSAPAQTTQTQSKNIPYR